MITLIFHAIDGATSQNHSDTHSEHGSEMSTESKKRKHRRKNFIKRNKEVSGSKKNIFEEKSDNLIECMIR